MKISLPVQFIPNYYKNLRQQENNDHNVELAKYLETLEEKLKKSAFFGGDAVSAVDYLIWPWGERLAPTQQLSPG